MSPLSDWSHETREFGARPRVFKRVASQAERAAVAEALGLLSCDRLVADYEISPMGGERFVLKGTLEASITQPCVVSLEPVPAVVSEALDAEFGVGADVGPVAREEGDIPVLGGIDAEPILQGRIDAGRLVFETLSATIDPYPRREGAAFAWTDPKDSAGIATGPFAALGKLKPKE